MNNLNSKKTSLMGSAAALGLAAAISMGGVLVPAAPALAEAVRVEAPKAPSFADVVEAVSPAVVSVRVKAKIQPASDNGRRGSRGFGFDNLPDGHPLKKFFERDRNGEKFGQRRNRRGEKRRGQRRGGSQGSGFFVSEDGYIVTNNHVIDGGNEFTVVTNTGDELDAKLIGTDPKTDLAVLKVEPSDKATYVQFSEKKARVGEWVVAVGNPFGLGGTVTAGIVSANGRDIGSGPYDDFIQIDAAVNKGNSGGPTFDLNGEVIGVNTAIFSPSGGNVGIAFAVSASTAQEVVDDLIRNGSVTRGWLGVQIQPVTKDIAASLGLKEAQGTIIAEAQDKAPAAEAGLKAGDVVLKVDGTEIEGPKALAKTIAGYEPDEVVKITILRDGDEQVVDVKLGKLPGAKKVVRSSEPDLSNDSSVDLDQLGISVATASGKVVVANVSDNSDAADKGIRAGDEIISINGLDTKSVADVGKAVAQAMEEERKAILFQFKSGKRNRFVALPVKKG